MTDTCADCGRSAKLFTQITESMGESVPPRIICTRRPTMPQIVWADGTCPDWKPKDAKEEEQGHAK